MVLRTLLAALCAVLAATPVAAQTSSAHTLQGVVRDFTGAVMVSVDVTLLHSDTSERQTAVTDSEGRFEFRGLSTKSYRVMATALGFADAEEHLTFATAPMATVELVLHVVIAESVEVSSDLATTPSSTSLTATMLTGAALEALPDDPNALLQRIRELAGATEGAGQVSMTIDGFSQSTWMPPKQAIQAIRISSNWFAPEFAEPGQARIEIITKPGTSAMHGELKFNFNSETLNARNALAMDHPSGHMRDATGFLSGPLIPGRWSYVAYGGQWTQRRNQIITATVLDARHQASAYGGTVSAPSTVGNLWVGTNYQLAPLHTLAVSLSRTSEHAQNLGLDSGLDLPERAYGRTGASTAVRATLTSVPTSRVLNELRVEISPQQWTTRAQNTTPAVMVLDAFTAGGNQDALFTAMRRLALGVNDSVTLFASGHTLKAGFDVRSMSHDYTDSTNFGGTYLFGTDFERDADGAIIGSVISPLENYRRTVLGLPGYGASQFWMARGNPEVRFRNGLAGGFAQDDWAVAPRLTVSYGVRADWQSAASRPEAGARAGIAFALDSGRKNMIRAGAGTFYERIEPELTLDVTRYDGQRQEQLFVDRPTFFPAVPANLSGALTSRPTMYVADRSLRAPQLLMSAVSYDRELNARMFVTLKYGHQHGANLLRTVYVGTGNAAAASAPRILRYESTGQLARHEVTSGWRWNAGARGSFFANYSFVHGRSDTDGRATAPADGLRLHQESGPMAGERTHHATIGTHVTLPAGLFVSPYLTAASGDVFNITTGFDNNGDGLLTDRPTLVTPGTPGAIVTPYGSFLASAPAGGSTVGRNSGEEPAMARLDVRVSRPFRYPTGAAFVVAGHVENLLNRANLEGVNGVITSSSFDMPKRAGAPRRITFSAGLSF